MVLFSDLKPGVIKVCRPFIITDQALEDLRDSMSVYLKKVLNTDNTNNEDSRDKLVQFSMSYISDFPTGSEYGNNLVLEFGGMNIRILLVNVKEKDFVVAEKSFQVSEDLAKGSCEKLFIFLASCLSKFIQASVRIPDRRIPLCIAWDFPFEQEKSLQTGYISGWSKGFNIAKSIGRDIGLLMRQALRQFKNLKRVYVVGIINEINSILTSTMLTDHDCKIGIKIDEALDIAYVERTSNIAAYDGNSSKNKVILNLKLSNFGDDGRLDSFRNSFDMEIDQSSNNPGRRLFDKMTGKNYLSEISRLVLVKLIEEKEILGGVLTQKMNDKKLFNAELLYRIESSTEAAEQVLGELEYQDVSQEDLIQVMFACRCVTRRCVNLVAATLAALMNLINDRNVVIAADGSLFRSYPTYGYYLNRKLSQIRNKIYTFKLVEGENATLGAGVAVACCATEVMNKLELRRLLPPRIINVCMLDRHLTRLRRIH